MPRDRLWRMLEATATGRDGASSWALCRDVVRLSSLFTREREALPGDYLADPGLRAAYLAYYLPVNLEKIRLLLDELPSDADGMLGVEQPLRVLDVGSGPVTAGLAVLDWAQDGGRPVDVTALDRSRSGIQAGREVWNRLASGPDGPAARLRTVIEDVESTAGLKVASVVQRSPYHLIIAANVINELFVSARDPVARRTKLVRALLGLLHEHGTMMIVEPALRSVTRQLHRLRDALVEGGCCTVYSPCLHERPCPALTHADDWCHEERPWDPPPLIAAIDREVGFIKDAVKFSYLLLRKDGRTIVPRAPDVYRVVSELRDLKGEKRAWLCNEQGRCEIGRLDRERSAQNGDVDRCHRGAIVRIEHIAWKTSAGAARALGRIEADGGVAVVRSVSGAVR